MKGRKSEGGGRSAARRWVTIRVTEKEKTRLMEQAEIAGLSLSEYMRRRFFGGRPLGPYGPEYHCGTAAYRRPAQTQF